MEIVDDVGILELVDLVKDGDSPRSIILLEPIDEFVMGCRLAVDVDGFAKVVEDLIECSESGVVAPAVDVGGFDVENLFAEPFGHELRDTGFPRPARSGYDGGVGRLAVRDRFENAGEMIDLLVAMLYFSWDKPSAEDASIANHLLLTDGFLVKS